MSDQEQECLCHAGARVYFIGKVCPLCEAITTEDENTAGLTRWASGLAGKLEDRSRTIEELWDKIYTERKNCIAAFEARSAEIKSLQDELDFAKAEIADMKEQLAETWE